MGQRLFCSTGRVITTQAVSVRPADRARGNGCESIDAWADGCTMLHPK